VFISVLTFYKAFFLEHLSILYHAHVHPKKDLPEKRYGQYTVGNLSTLLRKLLIP